MYGVFYAVENRKKTDMFDDRFVRTKWATASCHAFGLKINARDIVSIRKLDTFSTLLLLLSSICYCLSHCAVPVFAYILDLLV